jgi:hypothetical protein
MSLPPLPPPRKTVPTVIPRFSGVTHVYNTIYLQLLRKSRVRCYFLYFCLILLICFATGNRMFVFTSFPIVTSLCRKGRSPRSSSVSGAARWATSPGSVPEARETGLFLRLVPRCPPDVVGMGGGGTLIACSIHQCCGSGMFIPYPNFHPDHGFRIRIFSIPDPGSASNNLSILTQKIGFKTLGNIIRVVHPGSGFRIRQ